ncbi:MAG TPA: response regulator [Nitrososphaeraceae archaeon]|nr:response regulator [Nitrososphaeraceae archaeon]
MVRNWLVAIIDDELEIVNLFRDALSKISEVSVFTFTDPMAAFEHFTVNKNAYALIISDLRMPGINGVDLVHRIKIVNHLVRTLLKTAFEVNNNVFEEHIKIEVINGFLQKPIKLRSVFKNHKPNKHIQKLQIINFLVKTTYPSTR